jgi:integrase
MVATSSGARGVELRKGARSESIRIKFMYQGMECRESLKLTHTKQNINYAIRLRGEILNAIERSAFKYADYFPNSPMANKFGTVPTRVTIGELLREQLNIAERTLSPSTHSGYQQVYDSHLFAQWDKTTLQELTPPALRAWIGTLDCKIKTVRNILTPLRNALEQAINDDLIEYNPLDRVKLDKIMSRESRKSDYVVDPFDMAEILAILAACEGQEKNVWQHAFATGMRTSEFIALEWQSVDWSHSTISVDQVRVKGVVKDETKTQAGRRKIAMLMGAHTALMAQKSHTFLAGGLVFHDPRYGKGWADDQALKKRWARILRKAGVRYRNPYQTRHTFASTLLSAGANPLYVAKQMGHRDTEMITRNYGRWIEQGNDPETRRQSEEFFAQLSSTVLVKKLKPT